MKLGIRLKLIVLLAAVALIPLLGGLFVIVGGGVQLRLDNFRRAFMAVAASEVNSIESTIIGDLQRLRAVLESPEVVEALARRTVLLSAEEIQRLDLQWPDLLETDPLLRDVLSGPGAKELKLLRATSPHFTEIFFTDRHGQIVTATNRTSDYFQADENWWTEAYAAGKEGLAIPPIGYDQSSGVWSMDLCLPIFDASGDFVGVGKGVISLNAWFEELVGLVQGLRASVMLVTHDGKIAFRRGVEPLSMPAEEWEGKIAEGIESGWRVTAGGEMQAFAPIAISDQLSGGRISMPPLVLVVYGEETMALGALYRIAVLGLAIGLLGIGILFIGGLSMIDRTIVRRVLRLSGTARKVAAGDLTVRSLPKASRGGPGGLGALLRDDEIESLCRDFDDMVEKVEISHRQLASANELKEKFIAVAGHELRTPISYIVAMAKLLQSSQNVERLREALRTIGAKADHLNKVVQAMFKLLPDGLQPQALHYGEIEPVGFLEELRAEVQPFLEKRGQTLRVEALDLTVFQADRLKLFDVLSNLLSNAIKFTPDGGTVRLAGWIDGGEHIAFAVTDQGEGIPAGEMSHLFKPFFSGGDLLQHSTGQSGYKKRGIGLGLAIVRYFVELHGGTVEAQTGPEGSTFTVKIPIHP